MTTHEPILARLAALKAMSVKDLKAEWQTLFNTPVMSDNHLGRCRQPPWPVGLDGRRACPSGGQPHRPD